MNTNIKLIVMAVCLVVIGIFIFMRTPPPVITISIKVNTVALDNKVISLPDLEAKLAEQKQTFFANNQKNITVDLYIHKGATMGTVQDVKRILRKIELLNVRYRSKNNEE